MPDILLTHGYFLADDEKEQQIMKPYPPLGLLYISAYLRRAGFDVAIYDSTWGNRLELLERLSREPGGVLGIYTNLITRGAVLGIIAAAKRHGWTVVLGGPESANYVDEYLAHGADVVVVGEGEETLAELLPVLASRGPHACTACPGPLSATSAARSSATRSARRSPISTASPGPTASGSTCRVTSRHGAPTTAGAAST
jgi:hypothetical protein